MIARLFNCAALKSVLGEAILVCGLHINGFCVVGGVVASYPGS